MLEKQPFIAEYDAARFRGEFLQCFAEIEDHLSSALDRLKELGEVTRAPYLFGQKFERVRKSSTVPGLWKHKEHVEQVLTELQAFVELRGFFGHAIAGQATIHGEDAVTWETPGRRDWLSRKTLTQSEMRQALEDLRRLKVKFLKQPLVSGQGPNQASSPRPPSPA